MSKFRVIMPIGTSTLRWLASTGSQPCLPASWPGVPKELQDADADDDATADPRDIAAHLAQSIEKNPDQRTNAEWDSLSRWMKSRDITAESLEAVWLIASDEKMSSWITSVLTILLQDHLLRGVDVGNRTVEKLNARNMWGGLRNFLRVLTDLVRKAQQQDVHPVINGTAGFKAETGLATLAAGVLKTDIFYMHETMDDVVVLPSMPIGIQLRSDEVAFLKKLGGATTTCAANEMGLELYRERLGPFLEEAGGFVGVSALGELALAAHDVDISEQVSLQPREDKLEIRVVERERSHAPAAMERIAQKLGDALPFVRKIDCGDWSQKERTHVRPATLENRQKKVIELWYAMPNDDRAVRYTLYTTAETDEEYEQARKEVIDHVAPENAAQDADLDARPQESPAATISRLKNELEQAYRERTESKTKVNELRKENKQLREKNKRLREENKRLESAGQRQHKKKPKRARRPQTQSNNQLAEQLQAIKKEQQQDDGNPGAGNDDDPSSTN